MTNKQSIETIPFDAKITIEIPGHFYARLQQLTIHYSQSKSQEELVAAMQKLKEKQQAENEFEYHIQTLTILMLEIESAAKEQGATKMEEVEIPANVQEGLS